MANLGEDAMIVEQRDTAARVTRIEGEEKHPASVQQASERATVEQFGCQI